MRGALAAVAVQRVGRLLLMMILAVGAYFALSLLDQAAHADSGIPGKLSTVANPAAPVQKLISDTGKAVTQKHDAKKTGTTKAVAKEAVTSKAAAKKAVTGKATTTKAVATKAAVTKAVVKKAAVTTAVAEKAASVKTAASTKAVVKKAITETAAVEKAVTETAVVKTAVTDTPGDLKPLARAVRTVHKAATTIDRPVRKVISETTRAFDLRTVETAVDHVADSTSTVVKTTLAMPAAAEKELAETVRVPEPNPPALPVPDEVVNLPVAPPSVTNAPGPATAQTIADAHHQAGAHPQADARPHAAAPSRAAAPHSPPASPSQPGDPSIGAAQITASGGGAAPATGTLPAGWRPEIPAVALLSPVSMSVTGRTHRYCGPPS